jgi:predicted nucleic acid-binding protein
MHPGDGSGRISTVPRVFFDTNILIYQLDRRDPEKRRICREIVREHACAGQAVISTQVLQEFYVAATGKLRLDPLLVKSIIRTLENMEVVTIGPELIHEAIDTSVQNKLSFWDALVIVAAESANCGLLYSEDMNAGQAVRNVRIANPFR